MNKEEIKKVVEKNYDIKVSDVEKVKNTYKIMTEERDYCIKIINYEFKHFYFIISAINHLQENYFSKIPDILKTNSHKQYIKIENSFAYLTEWVPSRVSNYDNPLELALVSQKLGELHKCSRGFKVDSKMKPRIGWGNWIKVFNTRCEEILDFKKRINQKAHKSEFDDIYLREIDSQLYIAYKAIKEIREANYYDLIMKEIFSLGFCHHDYANHNVLVDMNGNINIIDFDYCMLDTHLHDLCSLLIRAMKYDRWEKSKADLIINNYNKVIEVTDDEYSLMKGFIRYPQSFWQIGLQYYWEQQPWGEEFFVNKINKYLEDTEERNIFIDEYFS